MGCCVRASSILSDLWKLVGIRLFHELLPADGCAVSELLVKRLRLWGGMP